MLGDLLGLSGALVTLATILLLLGGTWPLRGYLARAALLGALTVVAAALLGYLDVFSLKPDPPSPSNPATIVGAAMLLVALLTPRKWWAVGSITYASLLVATALYVVYLVGVTVALAVSPASLLLGLLLLAFQVVALALMVASVSDMVDSLCRPLEIPPLPTMGDRWPTVAFQVPVHQEPPDLVIQTVRSLVAMDYPREHLVVQVLDNNTTDPSLWRPLEAECDRLRADGHRVEFHHLEDWPGYKAGALDYGTAHLSPDVDILAIVDADYEVDRSFLRATIPYFTDPTVAFVQTPQEYRDWRSSGFYRACHTGFAYFFMVGMVSRSYRNSIIFAGTMGLIRRSALERIGGWDEEIITEDAEASLRLLSLGYRAVYLPVPYGRGIMPLTYEGLRQQRFRWAFGGMQILRAHWRALLPWARSGLTQRQRRDYLLGGLGWFNDALTLGFAAFIAATALGYLTGRPFVVQRLQGVGLVLPILYIGLGLVRYLWGLRKATGAGGPEAAAAMRVNLSLSWIVTLALVRGMIEKRGVFLRTPKTRSESPIVRQLRIVWVELLLAVVAGILAIATFVAAGLSVFALTVGLLLVWSALVYGSAVDFALGDPTRPPQALREKAALDIAQGAIGTAVRRAPAAGAAAAAGLVAVAVIAALVSESARPPVPGAGGGLPPGAIALAPPASLSPSPSASSSASSSASASSSPAGSASPTTAAASTSPTPRSPGASPAPSSSPTPAASSTPAQSSSPTPAASSTPTATPTLVPSPSPAAIPTATPVSSPPSPSPSP